MAGEGDAPLRPYQGRTVDWLVERGGNGLLALPLGSGKSRVTIEYLKTLPVGCYTLVVAPKVALASWEKELARWWPEEYVTLWQGTPQKRRTAWNVYLKDSGVLLVNYALLGQLGALVSKFNTIVFDESHTVRNRRTKQFKNARRIRADRVICLTGSPVVNGGQDLWSQMHLIDRKRFSSFWDFATTFLLMSKDRFGTHIEGIKDPEALQAYLGPYMLRLERADVLSDLPPKTRQVVPIALYPEQRDLYDTLAKEMLARLGTDEAGERWLLAPNTIALVTRLRQITILPELVGADVRSSLMDALMDSVEESDSECRPVLIFSPFARALEHVRDLLLRDPTRETHFIRGGMSATAIGEEVAEFQDSPSTRKALLCTTALGTSFTATAATTVLFLGCAWSPSANYQAEDRAMRIGQDHPVYVRYLVGEGTIDEHIEDVLDKKVLWAELATNPALLLCPPKERRARFSDT